MVRILVLFLVLLGFATSANSQEFHGEYKNWGVFTIMQSGKKICYITSTPISKKGNYRNRSEPYMLVTYRGKKPEISINSGFPFKKGSEVDVKVDSKYKYKFFTSDETVEMAWAKDEKTDRDLVTKMKKGSKLISKGYSRLGTHAIDTYSLNGFTKAYEKMQGLCK